MKISIVRPIALVLILAVTLAAGLLQRAQAMLIPAAIATTGSSMDPSADMQTIQKSLESKALRGRLHALGLSDAEIESRLSRLSDAQKHQLASQIRAVNPAGDGGGFIIGVLIIAVLVLLVIYLAKRI